MDYSHEIKKWERRRAELAAAGDLDAAEVVADHVRRLRELNGELAPDQRRNWQNGLTAWRRKRETLQADAVTYQRKGATALERRAVLDLQIVNDHVLRLQSMMTRG
ncbi:MAG: hypothetical protein ACSLE2_12815 [Lysobacterales bacterium]